MPKTLDELFGDPEMWHFTRGFGPVCGGLGGGGTDRTTDPNRVTCLKCLEMMASGRPTPIAVGKLPDAKPAPNYLPQAEATQTVDLHKALENLTMEVLNSEVPKYTLAEVGGGNGPDGLQDAAAPGTQPAPTPDEYTVQDVLGALPFAFLSGAAGSGKTFLARRLLETRDDVLFTATTGIAAVNLGDATTINSALGFSTTEDFMERYASRFLHYRLRMLRKSGYRILVIDETSMLEARLLEILCMTLDEIDQHKEYDEGLGLVKTTADDDGRMKILLVGDFCQLRPVEGDFAFEAGPWSRFNVLKLQQNRRHADATFIKALRHVRAGHGELALETFKGCLHPAIDMHFDGATIAAKNDAVTRINNLRHLQVKGQFLRFPTTRSGKQEKAWLKHIPEVLEIKVGAKVMILANRAYPKLSLDEMSTFYYVNGDLATVLQAEPGQNGVRVLLDRTMEEVVVTYCTKEIRKATGKKKPRYEVEGAVSYIPLRLAYGSTVHKSQGLTMDKVQVLITDNFFSEPGMLYVALSRARTLEGLRIVGTERMFVGRCGVDDRVRQWL